MKYTKFFFLIGFVCLFMFSSFAQYEKRFLFMGGESAGIEFDMITNEPRAHTLHSELRNEGGCVASHPTTGQLLFYSDGDTVYNAQHRIMLNGDGIFTEHCTSSVSGAVAVPKPDSNKQYYLFSNPVGSDCDDTRLYVSIIDMALDDGLGAILSTTVVLDNVDEGMVIIPKPNSPDYWIVGTGHRNSNMSHYILRVNSLGISLEATYQYAPTQHSPRLNLNYHSSTQKISSIYLNPLGEIWLRDFDPNTGILSSNHISIPLEDNRAYDAELSPDGSKVYYCHWNYANKLYQYNLNTHTTTLLSAPTNPTIGGGLLLGPDQKVYHIHDSGSTTISVIEDPDEAGIGCSYNIGGFELHTKIGDLNFPSTLVFNPPIESDTIRGIINEYARIESLCGNAFFVDNPSAFSEGDTVLIIQMQGVNMDVTNTPNFGTIIDYGHAGKSEYNTIQSINGNEIILNQVLANEYDASGSLQMISVPYLGDTVLDGVTSPPWNGRTGGVLIFSGGQITLNHHIDVSGRGFRGGQMVNKKMIPPYFASDDYFYPDANIDSAGLKGEGVFLIPPALRRGKGRNANGGGGGNDHNFGGGGGANAGIAGWGGYWHGNPQEEWENRGIGGAALGYSIAEHRVFMGGGGGAGHSNNYGGTSGGTGGGIVIIKAKKLITNGHIIRANGESSGMGSSFIDGGGGGGAGGCVYLLLPSHSSSDITVEAYGGKGSTVKNDHGHGGGGGGGILLLNDYPSTGILFNALGGQSGRGTDNETNLASDGEVGTVKTQFTIPFSTEIYEPLSFVNVETSSQCDSTSTIHVQALGTNIEYAVDNTPWISDTLFQKLTSGQHIVQITNGCTVLQEFIDVHNYPNVFGEILFLDHLICDSLGEIDFLATQGKPPFTYELIGRPEQQSNGVFEQLLDGQHTVLAIDDRNCIYQHSFVVHDQSYRIDVQLPEDTTLFKFDTLQLSPVPTPFSPPFEYQWYSPNFIDCVNCPSPLISPKFSNDVLVKITDKFGCHGEGHTYIKITDIKVYIPDAFSPNGDGINDFLFIQTKEGVIKKFKSMMIFNRWGDLVFEKKDQPVNVNSIGWNGNFLGKPCPSNVYIISYELELNNGDIISGSNGFTLIR